MALDDAIGGGESQAYACPLGLGGKKRLENTGLILCRDAAAAVRDR